MKKFNLYALVFIILILSCNKEKDDESNIIVGGSYALLSEIIERDCNAQIVINNDSINFNKVISYYADESGGPKFCITFIDTTLGYSTENLKISSVEFDLYTPNVTPSDFFQDTTIHIETIQLWHNYTDFSGYRDYFNNANIDFTWDNIVFKNNQFHGKGKIKVDDEIFSVIDTKRDFSIQTQTIEFIIE